MRSRIRESAPRRILLALQWLRPLMPLAKPVVVHIPMDTWPSLSRTHLHTRRTVSTTSTDNLDLVSPCTASDFTHSLTTTRYCGRTAPKHQHQQPPGTEAPPSFQIQHSRLVNPHSTIHYPLSPGYTFIYPDQALRPRRPNPASLASLRDRQQYTHLRSLSAANTTAIESWWIS